MVVVEANTEYKAKSHLFLVGGTLVTVSKQNIVGNDAKVYMVSTVYLFNPELKQTLSAKSHHVPIHPRKAVTFPNDVKYVTFSTSEDVVLRMDEDGITYTLSSEGFGEPLTCIFRKVI